MVYYEPLLTGPERMLGPVVNMSLTPTGTENPAPPLGHHTDDVLAEHGYDAKSIAILHEAGAVR